MIHTIERKEHIMLELLKNWKGEVEIDGKNYENIEAKSSRRRCGWKKNHSSALYLKRQKTISFEKNPEFVQRINRLI